MKLNKSPDDLHAEIDEALDRLADLERIITAIGGYMTAPQQFDLSCARELLKYHGRRK